MSDYIPSRDADALIWMLAFSNGISANPALYELSAADAATIAQAVSEFQSALIIAGDPSTRTEGNVDIKNTKRNLAKEICRQYAVQIKFNAGIDDNAKIDIGVRPVNPTREPVHCPQTSPAVNIVAASPGAQTLHYVDSFTPDTRKKPFGAIGLQMFIHIGDQITDDEDLASYLGTFTRNPVAVAFQPPDDGKMATYFARWVGRRGDTGPWSLPVSMRIAA